ncbi:MAG: hypothetical protein JO291_06125 [Acidimicrobiia bacterium]|nr:hypothetical protein [Acidimicrobiia bacterium]
MTRSMLALALALTVVLVGCNGSGPKRFSTTIDNPYWPMRPLTRWTYHEVDERGAVTVDTVIVTELTKRMANGVTARVVRDTARLHGQIVEDTFDWYAQAADGTVWYLGEDTVELEHGKVTSRAGSWEAGKDGARAGIMVPAHPRTGMRYREEYSKGNAEDEGEVLSLDEMADVPAGHYDHMLMIKDTSTLETRSLEYKLYAKGVGPALALGVSGDVDRESLVKVDRAPSGSGQGPLGSP